MNNFITLENIKTTPTKKSLVIIKRLRDIKCELDVHAVFNDETQKFDISMYFLNLNTNTTQNKELDNIAIDLMNLDEFSCLMEQEAEKFRRN